MKKSVRGKASFPDKNSNVMMICVRVEKNERNIYAFSGCRGMESSAFCSIFHIAELCYVLHINRENLFVPFIFNLIIPLGF